MLLIPELPNYLIPLGLSMLVYVYDVAKLDPFFENVVTLTGCKRFEKKNSREAFVKLVGYAWWAGA